MFLMSSVVGAIRRLRPAIDTPPQSECFEVIYVDHRLDEHSITLEDHLELQAALEQIREQGGYLRYVIRSVY